MRDRVTSILLERERLRDQLPQKSRAPEQPHIPRDVAIAFVANLSIGTIAWWLKSEESYSPEQIAAWFRRFALRGYACVLGGE